MFHLSELWEALTHGLNWFVAGGLLAAAWLWGRFQAVAGRRTETAIDRRWSAIERWRREHAAGKLEEKSRKAERNEVARLQRERVGKRFIRRTDPGDPGMAGEVVDLDPRDPKRRVILIWTSTEGRRPRADDYVPGRRISISWKDLTLSEAAQRHRTARIIAKSSDDSDGWVEFESLNEES